MILQILGFLVLVCLVVWFTFFIFMVLMFGGGDCGPLFSSWGPKRYKFLWIVFFIIDLFAWYGLYLVCPFGVTLK